MLIAAQMAGLSFFCFSMLVVKVLSMKSMAGITMVRFGIDRKK